MNFLLSDYPYIIAQNAIGNESAQAILDSSIELTRNTAESWNRIWDVTVNPEAGLWKAIVELGAFIAALTIIYLAIKEGQRLIDNPSWHKLINMFAFPLGIFLCLGGNGYLLSGTIITIRSIAYFWLARVLEITLADISIGEALQRLQVTNVANARAREIFADCIDKTGLELKECLSDPVKIAQAEQILQSLSERENPLNGNLLQSIVDAAGSIADLAGQAVTTIVTSAFVAPVQTILIALQWTFVNGVEIALFLTAMFAPIALGLSMIPSAGPSIIAWVTGFIGLFLTQLGYVIVVGVAASIISLTEEQGQAIGTIIPDIAFLLFLSIAAPIIAGLIAKAGGTALFNGISRSATTAVRLIAGAASGGTGLAASSAIASSRKANLTKPLSAKL